MPRADEPTPFRRIMMQSIMWVILGATVVAAAAVNQYKRRTLRPVLFEQVEFRGVSVQLPGGWIGRPGDGDENSIVRRNVQYGQVLILTVRTRGLTEMFGLSQEAPGDRPEFVQEIDLGGTLTRLMLRRVTARGGQNIAALEVSRSLPKARVLSISIIVPGAGDNEELGPEIDLIKRVAASVKLDPNY